MENFTLIKVLQKSVEKNGADYQMTLGHLLNIIELVDKIEQQEEEERDLLAYELCNDQ